jgi:hypothetical protein
VSRAYGSYVALLCALAAACASATDVVRDRASYDFGCPKDQIETKSLEAPMTIEARGCGKRSVYTSNGRTYVRNGEIVSDR